MGPQAVMISESENGAISRALDDAKEVLYLTLAHVLRSVEFAALKFWSQVDSLLISTNLGRNVASFSNVFRQNMLLVVQ